MRCDPMSFESHPNPNPNRKLHLLPFLTFLIVLIAYVTQSELSQLVQSQYQKPYFLLYLTHSAYLILFPLHLTFIKFLTIRGLRQPGSITELWSELSQTFSAQYQFQTYQNHQSRTPSKHHDLLHEPGFPIRPLIHRSITLTFLIAIPSLCWYAAVSMTDLTSITAIYNTNAFFAYVFSLALIRSETLELKKLLSVLGALLGVLIITFADDPNKPTKSSPSGSAHQRLFGTGLALIGSLTYAIYEVWYKRTISLPEPDSVRIQLSKSVEAQAEDRQAEEVAGLLTSNDEEVGTPSVPFESELANRLLVVSSETFVLHANLITSTIGLLTLTILWIPIPILHLTGWETFELPPNLGISLLILAMVSMGVIFNAGFMVLLGLWGPVIASVGNLCTLVLVAVADWIFVPSRHLTMPVVIGCVFIMIGFGVLVSDLIQKH